ncbi:cobyric acid synthase [Cyanobium sp. ATX 6A2]|uniref:cobyric acid synthase n=1 Tax=Cyanobium sp. ATX 6A2 TaxID=2823700 RepID=UPI0020CE4DEC|nr:cobyric acid synthase [Cyanobium sp. ATX 6A2]MCP9888898.1 cobyric acid synthase [Cyanobium sp. ATX 6A2]
MVLGTSSGAGKSLMTAALCRVLRRRGEQPLPFKGQNMSNNAWVDQAGGEMAYSQALQAWAAGLEPCCAMNPVLLKPRGDSTSEVIHRGRSAGSARAEHYYRDWFRPGWAAIRAGLAELQAAHPRGRLVLEGAGSPVEVNLQARDLTNLRLAQFLRARCLLVADIERGGVFAQIVGTLQLLSPVQRPLIRGLLINRFRGRRELFDEGRRWLERETGVPVLGVMPWLDELFPPEDSLDLLERGGRKAGAELEIAVLRLPAISNFSDFDPLEAEPSVRLRWLRPGDPLGNPDAVILPGSKQTLGDLAALRRAGLDAELQGYAAAGGHVFGLCGGLQLLGRELLDPEGLEGSAGAGERGLDLLPLRTVFGAAKALGQRRSQALWPGGGSGTGPVAGAGGKLELSGFELHRGLTTVLGASDEAGNQPVPLPLASDPGLGWWQALGGAGGLVAGTYLHGVFESGPWRRQWLNRLRQRRGLPPLSLDQPHHSAQRDQLLDRLADAFEAHVNLEPLLKP